jgi:thiol-disulfide isomerase/thioredoxin
MEMIGPFPRRTLTRIGAFALLAAVLLALAGTNIPTGTNPPLGINADGRYVIDPAATGPVIDNTFAIPAGALLANGGTYGEVMDARAAAGLPPVQLIIVDLFATWCPPCQQETPILRAFDRAYRERGLQIIGISVQELQGSVAAYAERYELEYPIVMDVDGALFRAASAGGLPTKILLDPSGRVLAVLPRPFTAADGATLIEPLLTP